MRVAIDTNGLYTTQAGVARYIRGLLKGLEELRAPGLEHFELGWPVENFGYAQPQRALKTAYRELFWTQFVAPQILRRRADLLHSTVNCLIPPPKGLRHVLSIMDLAFLRQPERFRRWQRWSWERLLARVPAVDRIITISRFTADEVMKLLGVPASKIEVVYLASDFHADTAATIEQKPDEQIPAEFFLFVGSLEPGKNLALLREVYELAAAQAVVLPPLVIVGARWEGVGREGTPPQNWQYLGRQPDRVLVYLYRRALALLFPSKYEGFGLPLCEAMTLQCPVICSPVASLPEVGGNAALFAEMNPEGYLKAMWEVMRNDQLRSSFIERGLIQARNFSWQKCAAETIQVYRSTCS